MLNQKKTRFPFYYFVMFQIIMLTSFYNESSYDVKFGLIANPYIWTFVTCAIIFYFLHNVKNEIKYIIGVLFYIFSILIYINLNMFITPNNIVSIAKKNQITKKYLQGWWTTIKESENVFVLFDNDSTFMLSPGSWKTKKTFFEIKGDFLYTNGSPKLIKDVIENQFTLEVDSFQYIHTRIDTSKIKLNFY